MSLEVFNIIVAVALAAIILTWDGWFLRRQRRQRVILRAEAKAATSHEDFIERGRQLAKKEIKFIWWTALGQLLATVATFILIALSANARNSPNEALAFNLAALATLVVTKGGLFLLTVVLIPAAKAIPGAVAGGYAWKKVNEAMDARKKEKLPTT